MLPYSKANRHEMYEQPQSGSNSDGGVGGVLLCIVIFLIFVMLFRGVRGRQECVIYMTDGSDQAPPAVAYTEKKDKSETGSAAVQAWQPAAGAGATTYASLD